MLIIRPSAAGDMDAAVKIYMSAKAALKAGGVDQWQDGYPNGASFLEDVINGIGVVIEQDGKILGTAAAYTGHEPTYDTIYDGKWLTDSAEYGLIHRIAVLTGEKNRGLASEIFSYVDSLCRERDLKSARCDTHKDNKIMQHTLEKNGYTCCGVILLENGDRRLGFEKVF